jgi:uncharacterized RDD family membrane protein YckC
MSDDSNWYAPPAGGSPASSPVEDEIEAQYAGFGVRAAARILDTLATLLFGAIGGAAGGVLAAVLSLMGILPRGWLERIQGLSAGGFAFGVLASVTYHTLAEGLGGASVGKALVGLRVTRDDLRPCGVGAAIKRNILYFVDSFFFGLVAYSSMSNSARQQRLGDKWGHTVVVRAASLPPNLRGGVALGIVGHVVVITASVVIRAL